MRFNAPHRPVIVTTTTVPAGAGDRQGLAGGRTLPPQSLSGQAWAFAVSGPVRGGGDARRFCGVAGERGEVDIDRCEAAGDRDDRRPVGVGDGGLLVGVAEIAGGVNVIGDKVEAGLVEALHGVFEPADDRQRSGIDPLGDGVRERR